MRFTFVIDTLLQGWRFFSKGFHRITMEIKEDFEIGLPAYNRSVYADILDGSSAKILLISNRNPKRVLWEAIQRESWFIRKPSLLITVLSTVHSTPAQRNESLQETNHPTIRNTVGELTKRAIAPTVWIWICDCDRTELRDCYQRWIGCSDGFRADQTPFTQS